MFNDRMEYITIPELQGLNKLLKKQMQIRTIKVGFDDGVYNLEWKHKDKIVSQGSLKDIRHEIRLIGQAIKYWSK